MLRKSYNSEDQHVLKLYSQPHCSFSAATRLKLGNIESMSWEVKFTCVRIRLKLEEYLTEELYINEEK